VVAGRMFHISIGDMLVQFIPATISGLLMAAVVVALLAMIGGWHPLLQLILAVLAGALVYAGTLYAQGPQRVRDIVAMIRNTVKGG